MSEKDIPQVNDSQNVPAAAAEACKLALSNEATSHMKGGVGGNSDKAAGDNSNQPAIGKELQQAEKNFPPHLAVTEKNHEINNKQSEKIDRPETVRELDKIIDEK